MCSLWQREVIHSRIVQHFSFQCLLWECRPIHNYIFLLKVRQFFSVVHGKRCLDVFPKRPEWLCVFHSTVALAELCKSIHFFFWLFYYFIPIHFGCRWRGFTYRFCVLAVLENTIFWWIGEQDGIQSKKLTWILSEIIQIFCWNINFSIKYWIHEISSEQPK